MFKGVTGHDGRGNMMTPPGVDVSAGSLSGDVSTAAISTAWVSTFHVRLFSFGTVSDKFSFPLFGISVSLRVTSGGGGLGFELFVTGFAREVGGQQTVQCLLVVVLFGGISFIL